MEVKNSREIVISAHERPWRSPQPVPSRVGGGMMVASTFFGTRWTRVVHLVLRSLQLGIWEIIILFQLANPLNSATERQFGLGFVVIF